MWWWVWTAVLCVCAARAARLQCPDARDAAGCACFPGLELELTCMSPAGILSAQLQPDGDYAKLQCDTPQADLNEASLPRVTSQPNASLPSVGFYSCGVGTNGTWLEPLHSLGYSSANFISLIDAPLTGLTAKQFQGLETTESLLIRSPEPRGPLTLTNDFFESLPTLRRFVVRGADLVLHPTAFINASTLEWLELSDGTLTEIPPNVFHTLRSLRRLSMWGLKLKTLPDGMLDGLNTLQELEVSSNLLHEIKMSSLKGAHELKSLEIRMNPLQLVEDGALRALTKLERVRVSDCVGSEGGLVVGGGLGGLGALRSATLQRCGIPQLSPDWLWGAHLLLNLTLSHNAIRDLPAQLFRDQALLQRLDLSHNQLTEIPHHIFEPLNALLELNLDHNKITELSHESMSGLQSLELLSARECGLQHVSASSLPASLRTLLLGGNALALSAAAAAADELGAQSPLHHLRRLATLDLAHNHVTQLYADWTASLHLQHLNLSHNNIQYLTDGDLSFLSSELLVDLQYNNISTLEMIVLPMAMEGVSGSEARVLLDHNPYRCDCRLYNLLERLQQGTKGMEGNLIVGDATCASPPSLTNYTLMTVSLNELKCDLPEPECPSNCSCSLRPAGRALELVCLEPPPPGTLPEPARFGLAGSELRLLRAPRAPLELPPHVHRLELRGLALLAPPRFVAAPTNLTLDLRNNSLSAVPADLLALANNRSLHLLLAHNPIRCDCAHAEQFTILKDYNNTISDWSLVECIDEQGVWVGARGAGAGGGAGCRVVGVALGAAAAALLALAAAGAALYYRHQSALRVWLLARGWLSEHDDEPATYDVFVSYAHQDEAWVAGELAPALEGGSRPLRLCLHHRDWVPGEWIPAQIARTVAQSRRTLVVLSPHFVESAWGQLEWRAAHVRALRERRRRVLVVLAGDVRADALQPDLRAYLATTTYLRQDDPRFWQKLRAALPRPARVARPAPAADKPYAALVPPSVTADDKTRY